jgi:hypothetical protein
MPRAAKSGNFSNADRVGVRYAHRRIDPATLTPYPRNARVHSPAQIDQLCKNIRKFGFTNPILIADDQTVLAGAGRLSAALQLGLPDVPCIVVTGLTQAERRALIVSDNKISLSSDWDVDLLIQELGEIADDGLMSFTGFAASEINQMLAPADIGDFAIPGAGFDPASGAATISVTVPSVIDVPSVAALIRQALKTANYNDVKVSEPH